MKHAVMFALGSTILCSLADAQEMIPLSQERGVTTGGFLDTCFIDLEEAVHAMGFDPFEEMVMSKEACAETGVSVIVGSNQSSTIDARSLDMLSSTSALLMQETRSTNLAIATSSFDVSFELTGQSDYLISGGIDGGAGGSDSAFWGAELRLSSLDTGEIFTLSFGGNGHDPRVEETFSHFGDLPGGRYRLAASATSILDAPGNLGESLVTAAFGVRLRLLSACRADTNGDGSLDSEDFFAYLDLFAAGDPLADIDGNGSIDGEDFFAYLDLFVRGCD